MQIELYSHGAAEEVTGSKHFLRLKDRTVMVDCGAFQGRREETDAKNRRWPFAAGEVSAVLLTHAHYDHCGLVPLLPKNGYQGNIYATPATRDLAALVMNDSAHIQAKDLEFLAKRAKRKGERFDKQPLYGTDDVTRALDQFVTISYGRPFPVADGIKATFLDAGHILGSAMVLLDVTHNGQAMRVAFTGDLGRPRLPILRDPAPLPDVDYLVVESTYGNRAHKPIDSAKDDLAAAITRAVKRGGKIIIPAFAVERTQEIIYFLHELYEQNRIPKVPVFVDSPMATNATAIFRVHQECYDRETTETFLDNLKNPFNFDQLRYVVSVQESKALNQRQEPMIIIASSGMCEAGRVLHHLANTITNPNTLVLIVGFMAQNTLGRRILEREPEVKIFNEVYPLRAEVVKLNTFSAHADYNDILATLGRQNFNRLKGVFLVHGEPDAQSALQEKLREKKYKSTIVQYGKTYTLQSS